MNGKTCRKAHRKVLILMGSFLWTSLALGAQSTSADKGDETVLSSLLSTRGVQVSQDSLPPAQQAQQAFEQEGPTGRTMRSPGRPGLTHHRLGWTGRFRG